MRKWIFVIWFLRLKKWRRQIILSGKYSSKWKRTSSSIFLTQNWKASYLLCLRVSRHAPALGKKRQGSIAKRTPLNEEMEQQQREITSFFPAPFVHDYYFLVWPASLAWPTTQHTDRVHYLKSKCKDCEFSVEDEHLAYVQRWWYLIFDLFGNWKQLI